jgi:hypothetical protein
MSKRGLAAVVLLLSASCAALAAEPPPAPERNPVRAEEPATEEATDKPSKAESEAAADKKAEPLAPGETPSTPWTDAEIAAAKAACTKQLADITLDYEPLPAIKEGMCGTPAPILVKSIGEDPKVEISPPATMNCAVAEAVAHWLKDTVQPQAIDLFRSQVVKLRNAASYACRNRYGSAKAPLSEHALANALDISEFQFASGDSVTVLAAWPRFVEPGEVPFPLRNPLRHTAALPPHLPPVSAARRIGASVLEVAKAKASELPKPPPEAVAPPPKPIALRKTEFVRSLHEAACQRFGTVLGPEANEAHKNHFHLDMKSRRSGFCE